AVFLSKSERPEGARARRRTPRICLLPCGIREFSRRSTVLLQSAVVALIFLDAQADLPQWNERSFGVLPDWYPNRLIRSALFALKQWPVLLQDLGRQDVVTQRTVFVFCQQNQDVQRTFEEAELPFAVPVLLRGVDADPSAFASDEGTGLVLAQR